MIPSWLDPLATAAAAVEAHEISRFVPPADGTGRESAVLILFGDSDAGPAVVLLERASTLRQHAGQAAFPGGACDEQDTDIVATALREAAEEVGLDPGTVEVFGELPTLFLPVTGFIVAPVLAYWRDPHPVSALDVAEVAEVVVVPVRELVDPVHRFTVRHPSGYAGPGFQAGQLFVWGFTAGILDAVLRLGGWEQPWDPSRTREIPASAIAGVSAPAGTVEP